jgi:hypothetical protein
MALGKAYMPRIRAGGLGAEADTDPKQQAIPGNGAAARAPAYVGGLKSGKRLSKAAFKNLKWAIVVASS